MIKLLESWHDRFGRSNDFHGAFVTDANVVAATCIGIARRSLQDIEFDLCIVDEASKATPTEILVPASRSSKWVIVGDSKQLPPFVNVENDIGSKLDKYNLSRDDLKSTLLAHLTNHLPSPCHRRLETQHRMVPPIGNLISSCFYDGKLKSVGKCLYELDKAQALPKPVTWFSTSGLKQCREDFHKKSYINLVEIHIIERFLRRLSLVGKSYDKVFSVVLLSGYLPQVGEMKRLAARLASELLYLEIECQTVDAFQGREADVAVYSITRSNESGKIGFLKETERLNVALSRAKHGLAIVGDSITHARHRPF